MTDPSIAASALEGAAGAVVILSANPMHDTGGGQRSAQLAIEFLARDFAVLFVSHGKVTETVHLGLSFRHPRLVEQSLAAATVGPGNDIVRRFLQYPASLIVTQIPVRSWLPVLSWARRLGAVSVYDLIDEWDSELGHGWYGPRIERRVAGRSDILVASAPRLQRYLRQRMGRDTTLLPNAYNDRVFHDGVARERPADLPAGPVAIYVGSLWGSWMDWHLIEMAAKALPDIAFVFVGDHRTEGAGLPANCHFLGLKAQRDLPAYLQHSAVALLPWKDDRITQATSPLKVYEYVAMGLRVVSPPLEPLSGIPGVVHAPDPRSYVKAIRTSMDASLSAEERQQMAAYAAEHSWSRRVDTLIALIGSARRQRAPLNLLTRLRAWIPW